MKKKSLVILAFLVLFAAIAFAAPGTKTFNFGPNQYAVSEYAPDFSTWQFNLMGSIEVTPEPTPCSMFIFEGVNPSQTVLVRMLIVKEDRKIYLAGIIVMYIPADGSKSHGECYEDIQYFSEGNPSFILTKVDNPSDVDKLIQIKKMQFGKKIAI